MSIGEEIIASLEDFNRRLKNGEPIRQTVMRRMVVKGKIVYTQETFVGPIQSWPAKGQNGK